MRHLKTGVMAQKCNCSICEMTEFVRIIAPERQFCLNGGRENLSHYQFNTGTADHIFCRTCGVKSYYRPRSNPDGWSINACCLDSGVRPQISIEAFDGQNWEANAHALAHLSRE